jgi:hypothetical protein
VPWSEGGVDPALGKQAWKKLRVFWRQQGRPCWRCGLPIRYDLKWPHPLSMVVGHIVGRVEARERGWPESRINAISNTLPEHVACSNRSGAQSGRRRKDKKPARVIVVDRW